MELFTKFDVKDAPEDEGFLSIPAGRYEATIGEADVKDTASKTGQYINLRLDIIGPTQEGRVVFAKINIKNDSEKAEQIGRSQLGSIQRAAGISVLSDTDQLVGARLMIKVARVKNEEFGDAEGFQNEVKGFSAVDGSQMPSTKKADSSESGESNAGGPPWAKK